MKINGMTTLVGVLGHPIAHSASPAMHNAAFDSLGMNACYVAMDVDPSDLKEVLRGLALAGFLGVNLTVPHKEVVLPYLDECDESVKLARAANTICFSRKKNGRVVLTGYNTDGYGILKALKQSFRFNPRGKTVAIVGCGGAGRGVAMKLAVSGVKRLVLLNRTVLKAEKLGRQVLRINHNVQYALDPEPCDLLIQATSLGLKPSDPLPLNQHQLKMLNPARVYDMIYRPDQTALLKWAHRCKLPSDNGLGMLLHQGAKAFEIWTRRKAPLHVMKKALWQEVYDH